MLTALAATVASADGGQDILRWALDQGGAFLVAVVCAYGWFRAEKRVERADARADAERSSRNELATAIIDRFVPAIEASTASQRDFVDFAREQQWRSREHRGSAPPA